MAIYNVHAGHGNAGGIGCGASSILDESTEARKVKDYVIAYLKELGNTVYDCTYNGNTSQNLILRSIVSKCNQHSVDLDVSIHLNSGRNDLVGNGNTGGVEVYGYNLATSAIGSAICKNIANSLGYTNRGFKTNSGLYVLRNTKSNAILIECAFVDDKDDAINWNAEKCASAIVEAITGKAVGTVTPEQKPVVVAPQPVSNKYSVGQNVTFSSSYPSSNLPCSAQYATFGGGNGTITAIVSGQAKYQINNGTNYCNDGDIRGLYTAPVANPTPVVTAPSKPDVIYAVYAGGRWYPEVRNNSDYAGVEGKAVTAIAIRLSNGAAIKYRVHLTNGRWLPYVTGFNYSDGNNGYAGNGSTSIDALEIKCDSYDIRYKVSTTSNGATYYSEVADAKNDYAGVFGRAIDKVVCRVV
jgi:hypothetical protein